MPLKSEVLVKMATDPEATQSSVSIVRKRSRESQDTVSDYRRSLSSSLVYEMLNERFDEIARKADAPFLSAGAYGGALTPTVNTFTLAASVQDGKIERGLAALEVEANRVEQYGFGAGELDRARKWMLASYDRAYAERDKTESGSYVQEYVNHFLQGEPTPGIDYEHKLVQALVPTITAGEVATAAKAMFADTSRVILGVSPQKAGVTVPTDCAAHRGDCVSRRRGGDALDRYRQQRRSARARCPIRARSLTGARSRSSASPSCGCRMASRPGSSRPTSRTTRSSSRLPASGGSSLAPPEKYVEAQLATGQVELSGAGGHRAIDLPKLTAGKIASASPFISLSSHGIQGSSTPANLETALQLLNIKFTAPGDDAEAFALIKRQLEAAVVNRLSSPTAVFGDKLGQVLTMGHYTSRR